MTVPEGHQLAARPYRQLHQHRMLGVAVTVLVNRADFLDLVFAEARPASGDKFVSPWHSLRSSVWSEVNPASGDKSSSCMYPRKAFTAEIAKRLPALAAFIDRFEIPESMRTSEEAQRCGVDTYRNPTVQEMLVEISPEHKFF
jgi:hypothetical protein